MAGRIDRMKSSLFLLAFLVSTLASADWTKIESSAFPLPPPPKAGSAAEKQEYRILHEYQESRTQAQCDLANEQALPSFGAFFGTAWGGLSKKEVETSEKKISKAMKFAERVSGYWKAKYKRVRPYNVDETLTPCVDEIPGGNKAYPSSHATMAAIGACLLAHKYPEKAEALHERGKFLGDLRVIVGVHHPSDVAKGQELGKAICERLLEESDFDL